MTEKIWNIIIVGGGQSGLAVAYYLRRFGLDFLILDAEEKPGGSWQNYWDSLKLFSPAQWSSLPGRLMNGGVEYYPCKDDVVDYFSDYENHYQLNVVRPVQVTEVFHLEKIF